MKIPEQYRVTKISKPDFPNSFFYTTKDDGCNGLFIVSSLIRELLCIASDGMGWEHVSVHGVEIVTGKQFTPTWAEMCKIKDLFWDEEDCVIQYHPPKSVYVNCHPHTLHLWRPAEMTIPIPETILIGPKEFTKTK